MPHLDHPSLAYYAPPGFDSFITVMVAIDPMTPENGCLRVVRGRWNADNAVACIEPQGDPEVGGRAGAITEEALKDLVFEDIICDPGDVLFFNGYVPHRSGPNLTSAMRRAIFLTYNPAAHGEYRATYYANLERIRNEWKERLCAQVESDYQRDLAALATVPSLFDPSRFRGVPVPRSSAAEEADPSSSSEEERDLGEIALF